MSPNVGICVGQDTWIISNCKPRNQPFKSSVKTNLTSKHQDPCFQHCQRGFHRFSDPCQLSLELAMRNVILWRRNKTKWIYLHDKEKKKLFCFLFSKTLQVLKMKTNQSDNLLLCTFPTGDDYDLIIRLTWSCHSHTHTHIFYDWMPRFYKVDLNKVA